MNRDTVYDMDMPEICFDSADFLLKNPNRGLRGETYITLGKNLRAYPGDNEEPFARAERLIEKYREDSPTVFQAYVYLCDYSSSRLDALAFEQLESFFKLFEKHGIRLLLRFAYSTEALPDVPYETALAHLTQLKKWFNEKEDLISKVIFCMQTGIVGFWGEGHSSKKFRRRYVKNIIGDICELVPNEIYSQVRTYAMLKKTPAEYAARVGIHDDYITGDTAHKWAFVKSTQKKRYARAINHARFTVNDGEMPWGRAYLDDRRSKGHCDNFNGIAVLKQVQAYFLTTFSLEHSYREDEGKAYSMQKWKSEKLSYADCARLKISANPALFKDAEGNEIKLSIFDILRYHLGYQLAVKDLYATESEMFFSLTNYGFAPPLTFDYFAAVFRNADGKEYEIPFKGYNKNALLSGRTITYKAEIPYGSVPVGLKLETKQGSRICARFANEARFENGVQYFK